MRSELSIVKLGLEVLGSYCSMWFLWYNHKTMKIIMLTGSDQRTEFGVSK